MKDNLINMVMDRASRNPSRDVFRYKNTNNDNYTGISWANMIIQFQKVARALIYLGFGYEDKIGIFSENRLEWMLADLGIIGIRGIAVPFYATASKQQLKYIVDETQMKLIFVSTREQYEKSLWLLENTETLKKIIVFDPNIAPNTDSCIDWQKFIKLAGEDQYKIEMNQLLEEAQPEDLINIIYTSGTTGESKGVMLTHASFIYTMSIHDMRLEVSDTDVSACFLPLSHIFELTWTYYILHCGATNAFISNPREIVKYLPIIKPNIMCTVPRFFDKTYEGIQLELAKWPNIKKNIFNWAIKTGHKNSEYLSQSQKPPIGIRIKYAIADKVVLKKLRDVFGGKIKFMPCAGAAIRSDLLRFFHAAGIFITYGYGASETSATVSCFKSDRYDFNTVGTIMPGIEVKISDKGEIMVKGNTVFRGYYKKPDETAKCLIDGWFYTGDEGYITPNNDIVMTDRIKDLIKTSVGKYVSPQKIELLFTQDPFIEQIIAIGDDRKYITALIVPAFETLKKEAEKLGLGSLDNSDLIEKKEIIEFYYDRINKIQEEFTSYEKVVKFKLLSEPFSIQNGLLTNTLKVRRNLLIEQFKEDIELMYS
jgi:long-chain acyl-CoA synthetase